MEAKEIWKPIPGYEGIYDVSSHGRIKSLKRTQKGQSGYVFNVYERILKGGTNREGYLHVILRKSGNPKTRTVHQLVAEAFLNHVPCGYKLVVDHIDNDKLNNHVTNLQIITPRENASKDMKQGVSKYRGVTWTKNIQKWRTKIRINGKKKHLGYFYSEEEAGKAYQDKLKEIKENAVEP